MINIRSSVFETNSSSTHSVSLTVDNSPDFCETIVPDKNGEIIVVGEDFTGLEYSIARIESKVALIAAYIFVYNDMELKSRFEKIVKDHTGAKKITYDLRFVSKNGKNANTFYFPSINDSYYHYDDDDDEGEGEGEGEGSFTDLLQKDILIKRFLFNKESYIDVGEMEC